MLGRFEERNFFELLAEDAKFGIESRASLVAARCVEKQIAATSETKKVWQFFKNCARIQGFADRSKARRKKQAVALIQVVRFIKNTQPISVGV